VHPPNREVSAPVTSQVGEDREGLVVPHSDSLGRRSLEASGDGRLLTFGQWYVDDDRPFVTHPAPEHDARLVHESGAQVSHIETEVGCPHLGWLVRDAPLVACGWPLSLYGTGSSRG
jgi:hypothetical protein